MPQMKRIKIGLLRETKTPPDRRIALSPKMAAELLLNYPKLDIVVQPNAGRCFTDQEFTDAGIRLQEDLSDCNLLLGIKEVSIPTLIEGKQYLFFAHVAKKQAYNKALLKAILEKKVTLTDYEYLTDVKGIRLLGGGPGLSGHITDYGPGD
jgi:alanine dehydrogenase